ncbi:18160_t:CDS:2 [Rhizophagus irregularis]|nr:18160_t:CDS:2 [Rhizophagus irregularis]
MKFLILGSISIEKLDNLPINPNENQNHVPSEITAKADIHTDYDKVYYDGEAYFDDPIFQSEKVTNEEAPKVLDKIMATILQKAGNNCYQKKDSVGTTDTVTIYKRIYEDVSSAVNDRDKLIIIQNTVEKCFGEASRDSIDNTCQIMEQWQKVIIKEYETRYGKRYESFSHLFYEAYDLSKEGDDEIKYNLLEIGEDFGDVTFDEMRWMVIYRSARNKIAHKKKWYPDHRNFHIQHNEALECINLVTGTDAHIFIRRRDLFRSGLEKTINYLYS